MRPADAAEHDLSGLVDVRLLASDAGRVWLDAGLDKQRFGDGDEPVALGALLLDYRGRWFDALPSLGARVTLATYDGRGAAVDLLEAFLDYRPVPRSASRWRARVGIFYPPVSLGNSGIAWSSVDTLSSSAIDTWIGEEIRSLGGELEWTRMGRFSGSPHDISLVAAAVRSNDPAGALLSWRGWSLHDRQTGWSERLELAELPAFGPDGSFFGAQGSFEEPFVELDGRTGWYAGASWDAHDRSRLRYLHYDNRGDPLVVEEGQWAWRTRFDHLGWQLQLPRRTDLVVQLVTGDTRMDGFDGPLVYVDFRAGSLLVSRVWGRHRATLRFDSFEVEDLDSTPDDPNQEHGHAWTASYLLALAPAGDDPGESAVGSWQLAFELLDIDSDRPARQLLGEPSRRHEASLQLALQGRF